MNRNINDQLQQQNGVDIRNPSTAVLGISSVDRYKDLNVRASLGVSAGSSSPFDFTITSNQNLLAGYFTRVAVNEIHFPWTVPTITFRTNGMSLQYRPGGVGAITTYFITVPIGWYTPTTLAAALQTSIRTATGNAAFTVTYSTTQYEFTAASTNGSTFLLSRSAVTEGAGAEPQPNRMTMYEMMNWTGLTLATTQDSGIPTMLSTPFVDIVSTQLTYNQAVKDADTGAISRDILCRVYLTPDGYSGDPTLLGSAPLMIERQFAQPKQIKWSPNIPIGNLSFQVYDSQGYLMTFSAAEVAQGIDATFADWNMTLLVSEV